MEAVILIVAAWVAVLYLEAGYWILRALLRWTPLIAVGVAAGWVAQRIGLDWIDVLGVGIVACLVARNAFRPRYEDSY